MSMSYELMMKKKGMPSRYQEVEYIESDGNQYIITGIKPKDTIGAYAQVMMFETRTNAVAGSREANSLRFYLYWYESSKVQYGWNSLHMTDISPIYNQKIDISLNYKNDRNYIFDGNIIVSNLEAFSGTSTRQLYLFNANLNGTAGVGIVSLKGRIYNAQITEGNSVIRNYIPVYDTLTQKYGMWESVQGKFYGNDGTGDFKGSIVGYTKVGSPTITDGVVSGFTTNDYVRTSQDWDTFADAETWKIHTRITTGESYSTTRATGIISGQGFQTGFGISNNGYLQAIIYLSDNSSFSLTTSFVIESNTSYDIELEKTQSQYIFRVKKTNTVTWEEKTNNSTLLVRNNAYNPNYLYFGNVNYFNVVFTGSIDMNETIIFVNNKLYFNGQQA